MPDHTRESRAWASLHPGRKALKHVARVLEQRPKKDDHELSHLTRCLAEFRKELIAKTDGDGASARDRERLSHLNAIISVAMGMHFPVGDAPWDEFKKTEVWLTDMVDGIEA